MKLGSKLMLLLVGCALLPLAGVSILSYQSARDALSEQLESSLLGSAQILVGHLQGEFDEAVTDVHTWSSLGIMQDALTDDVDGGIAAELLRLRNQYPHFSELLALNSEGDVIASTHEERASQALIGQDVLFRRVAAGERYQSAVVQDELLKHQVLVVADPIRADYDADTIIGALVGVIGWPQIQAQLAAMQINGLAQDAQHRVLLRDGQSTLLYQTSGVSNLSGSDLSANHDISRLDAGSQRFVMATRPFEATDNFDNPGWVVHSLVDIRDAYAAVDKLRNRAFVIGAVVLVLILIVGWMGTQQVVRPLRHIHGRLNEIADGDGDLTVTLDVDGHDEVADLAKAFNRFVTKIRTTITQVADNAAQMAESAAQLSAVAQNSNRTIAAQREETQSVAGAVADLNGQVADISASAEEAASSAQDMETHANQAHGRVSANMGAMKGLSEKVQSAATVIQQLEQDSAGVGTILDVIRGIADQTNLLALNAAIEAARAGEAGRGFAVVADEVRGLASKTQESINEIESMIGAFQTQSRTAVQVMNEGRGMAEQGVDRAQSVIDCLGDIEQAIRVISQLNQQIASAVSQQSKVSDGIRSSLNAINKDADSTMAGATQTEAEARHLNQQVESLRNLVGQFRVR